MTRQEKLEIIAPKLYKKPLEELTDRQVDDLNNHLDAEERIANLKLKDKIELMIGGMTDLKAQKDCENMS